MRLRALRPVGERLPPLRQAPSTQQLLPGGYDIVFTQSGTASLALALRLVASKVDPGRRKVLLPAYGCPDLVSAVCFNGLESELVDTASDSPFMSLERLRAQVDDSVLAVVGAHFLGLAEDIAGIEAACAGHGITVIEDSAQRVPGAGDMPPLGQCVVMSFGRGKPAGALGGGALLWRRESSPFGAAELGLEAASPSRISTSLKRIAYNQAIGPLAFGIVSRLPGLELGVTRYKPLDSIRRLEPGSEQAARCGWAAARSSPRPLQALYCRLADELTGLRNLPAVVAQGSRAPLNRFPVLLEDPMERDRLVARLAVEGLGASCMYGKALADLEGVPTMKVSGVESARSFASRLVTLPLHSDVRTIDVDRMEGVLQQFLT